jgi:hypothetical protein
MHRNMIGTKLIAIHDVLATYGNDWTSLPDQLNAAILRCREEPGP